MFSFSRGTVCSAFCALEQTVPILFPHCSLGAVSRMLQFCVCSLQVGIITKTVMVSHSALMSVCTFWFLLLSAVAGATVAAVLKCYMPNVTSARAVSSLPLSSQGHFSIFLTIPISESSRWLRPFPFTFTGWRDWHAQRKSLLLQIGSLKL